MGCSAALLSHHPDSYRKMQGATNIQDFGVFAGTMIAHSGESAKQHVRATQVGSSPRKRSRPTQTASSQPGAAEEAAVEDVASVLQPSEGSQEPVRGPQMLPCLNASPQGTSECTWLHTRLRQSHALADTQLLESRQVISPVLHHVWKPTQRGRLCAQACAEVDCRRSKRQRRPSVRNARCSAADEVSGDTAPVQHGHEEQSRRTRPQSGPAAAAWMAASNAALQRQTGHAPVRQQDERKVRSQIQASHQHVSVACSRLATLEHDALTQFVKVLMQDHAMSCALSTLWTGTCMSPDHTTIWVQTRLWLQPAGARA